MDYKNLKANRALRRKNQRNFHWRSFFPGLAIGLCVAVFAYFYPYMPNNDSDKIKPEVIVKNTAPKIPQHTPLPSFDFYNILTQQESSVSEWSRDDGDEHDSQEEPNIDERENYVLQVGSFKQYKAADTVKARLALIGITAYIQQVVLGINDTRHRVRVGPYSDPDKISELRQQLTGAGMDPVLIKIDHTPTTQYEQ